MKSLQERTSDYGNVTRPQPGEEGRNTKRRSKNRSAYVEGWESKTARSGWWLKRKTVMEMRADRQKTGHET